MTEYDPQKIQYKKQGRLNQKGFTLAELMVAAAILIFCIIGLMQGFTRFSEAGVIAENKIQALTKAQSGIERIRNTNFGTLASWAGTGWRSCEDEGFCEEESGSSGCFRIQSVETNLLQIEVVVAWESIPGRLIGSCQEGVESSPMTLRTLITRR